MAYIAGYLAAPVLIALCIVAFAIRPGYQKKHGKKMGAVKAVLLFLLISLGILFLSLVGKLA